MVDTARAVSAILTIFQDGQVPGSINPQDLRDFIVTSIGHNPVNIFWYASGATIDDGTTDASVALNAAIATGNDVYCPKPATAYRLLSPINLSTTGQVIFGNALFTVDSSFTNMSANGIFITGVPGPPGPHFMGLTIKFTQPDTTTRGSLTTYPPAFYNVNQGGSKWTGVRLIAGTNGIDLSGTTSGGYYVDRCKFECFGINLLIDGAADDGFVTNNLFEADELTANQRTIYFSAGTVGLRCGRADGIHITNNLFIAGLGIDFIVPSGGAVPAFGTMSGNNFDSYNGIACASAVQITGSSNLFTLIDSSMKSLTMTSGRFELSSCQFYTSIAITGPQIQIVPASSAACKLVLNGCRISSAIPAADFTSISITNTIGSPSALVLNGCNIELPTNTNKSNAAIVVNGSANLTMTGCFTDPAGSATGNVVAIATDGRHVVVGNTVNGWGISLPGGHSVLVSANNA